VAAATYVSIKWKPVGLAKLFQRRARAGCVLLSRAEHDAPMRCSKEILRLSCLARLRGRSARTHTGQLQPALTHSQNNSIRKQRISVTEAPRFIRLRLP